MSAIAKLDTRRLDQLLNEAVPQKEELLNTIANDIEGLAKERAPVKTGNLKDNIKAERVDDDTTAGHHTAFMSRSGPIRWLPVLT